MKLFHLGFKSLPLVLALVCCGYVQSLYAEPGSLIVFGDSWSDTGNDRRFTDGLVWHEHLAEELGLPIATPSFQGGSNNAIGGLRIANDGIDASRNARSFAVRVDDYLENNSPDDGDVFFIWSGTPDFLVDRLFDPNLVATRIADQVTRLANAGAEHFVLGNVPLLGQTPWGISLENGSPDVSFGTLDNVAREFDTEIRSAASQLKADLGIQVGIMDVMSVHEYVLANPCRTGGPFCDIKAEGGDLFVDNIHFRTEFHQLLVEPAKNGMGFPKSSRVVGGWNQLGRDTHWDDISVTADGSPSQSSDFRPTNGASNAVDSDLATSAQTSNDLDQHWWRLEFAESTSIRGFKIRNGRSGTRSSGLTDGGGLRVELLSSNGDSAWHQDFIDTPLQNGLLEFLLPEELDVTGHAFQLSKLSPASSGFNLAEVDVISDALIFEMDPEETWIFEIDGSEKLSDSIGFGNGLDINGSTIQVDLLQGELSIGDSFDLIDATHIEGTFANLHLPELSEEMQWITGNLVSDGTIAVAALGDFDNDGTFDASDIDELSGALGETGNPTFDLDQDGLVSLSDHTLWINRLGVVKGDTNFDGNVDFVDFLNVSANFGGVGGWGEGDFDGSGDIQFPDFLFLSKHYGGGATAASVPEPSSMCIALIGLVIFSNRTNRSRTET